MPALAVLVVVFLAVVLDCAHREDEDKQRENNGLDEAHEKLEAVNPERDDERSKERQDEEQDTAGKDVSEKAEGEADDANELRNELEDADERENWVLERADEELSEVAKAKRLETPEFDDEKGKNRESEGIVEVAERWTEEGVNEGDFVSREVEGGEGLLERLARDAVVFGRRFAVAFGDELWSARGSLESSQGGLDVRRVRVSCAVSGIGLGLEVGIELGEGDDVPIQDVGWVLARMDIEFEGLGAGFGQADAARVFHLPREEVLILVERLAFGRLLLNFVENLVSVIFSYADRFEDGRQRDPVGDKDEEKEARYDWKEATRVRLAGDFFDLSVEEVDDGLDEILGPGGNETHGPCHEERADNQDDRGEPGGHERGSDGERAELPKDFAGDDDMRLGTGSEDESETDDREGDERDDDNLQTASLRWLVIEPAHQGLHHAVAAQ